MLNTSVTDTVHNAKQQLTAMIASTTQDNDGIRGAQVDPMLGWEVIEREQLIEVVGELLGGLGELRPVGGPELRGGVEGMVFVLGVPDLGERLLRSGMG
jgi:hypothetical protein